MRKIAEMLRLKAAGMNNRDIARSTAAGKTTVYEHLARAEAAGLDWPLAPELDDAALEAMLFPPPTAELAASRPLPDWRGVLPAPQHHRHPTRPRPLLLWRRAVTS